MNAPISRIAWRRRAAASLAVGITTAFLITPAFALPAAAAPVDDPVVASGDGWSVTDLGGVYEVEVELDRPLEMRSDAPTIEVDGEAVGFARESADGKKLTVLTSDPIVRDPENVEAGWFAEAGTAEEVVADVPAVQSTPLETSVLGADPSVHGDYAYTESIYRFGDQAIDLAGIGGIRGEVEGKIYLPSTGGARPLVMLLHGRHSSCAGSPANPLRWPCSSSQVSIPSYAGYDGTAESLASNGYAVVSISANAINSNDNQLALDFGARARGQLILDTLELLREANAGEPIVLHDAATGVDVTLADALTGNGGTEAARIDPGVVELTPNDLVGRFDFSRIGLMGHSRGGEGVTSAATLNQALAEPFNIVSTLPLAPVDFGRMTVPNVPNLVILPYCDGDVSNQQGQHMNDDARYAFGDDVLRSDVWVMGANHNFFNTVWTPGLYSFNVSDDWSGTSTTSARAVDSVCGTAGPAVDTTIRLSPSVQYDVGTSLMTGWFRATVGGEEQFLAPFDGSGVKTATTADIDVRTIATQPDSTRADIETFEGPTTTARTYGSASLSVCASLAGRAVPQELPACSTLASAQVPHWTNVRFAGDVPATPLARVRWSDASGEVRVPVPAAHRDASDYTNLSFRTAADESVPYGGGTDLKVSVVDGAGATFSVPASELNPAALVRLPQSTQNPTTLGKIVLQKVSLPLANLAAAGLDITDLREVRFAGATGVSGTADGAAYVSDLSFDRPSLGQAAPQTMVAVDSVTTYVEERVGPNEVQVPVVLSAPATSDSVVYVSVLGSTAATSKVGVVAQKVTFARGEVCKAVTVPTYGDTTAATAASTAYTVAVTNTRGVVMGSEAFAQVVVREDDGVVDASELPLVGVADDACAEVAARAKGASLSIPNKPVAPGTQVAITGKGFRAGESVAVTAGDTVLGSAVTGADGSVKIGLVIPAGTPNGDLTVAAEGAGSSITADGTVKVKKVVAKN